MNTNIVLDRDTRLLLKANLRKAMDALGDKAPNVKVALLDKEGLLTLAQELGVAVPTPNPITQVAAPVTVSAATVSQVVATVTDHAPVVTVSVTVPVVTPPKRVKAAALFGLGCKLLRERGVSVYANPTDEPNPSQFLGYDKGHLLNEVLWAQDQKPGVARNVILWGEKGTGKTSFVKELAARTGRPFFCVSFYREMGPADLLGSFQIAPDGTTFWKDGALLKAIRTPNCVVLLDEFFRGTSSLLIGLNGLLQSYVIVVPETGERVVCAPGVSFFATDNTNGSGDSSGRYGAAQQHDSSLLARFGTHLCMPWLPEREEAATLAAISGVTRQASIYLIYLATGLRAANSRGETSSLLPSLRDLGVWAEKLRDGLDPERTFRSTLLGGLETVDVEAGTQVFKALFNPELLTAALAGQDIEFDGRTTAVTAAVAAPAEEEIATV